MASWSIVEEVSPHAVEKSLRGAIRHERLLCLAPRHPPLIESKTPCVATGSTSWPSAPARSTSGRPKIRSGVSPNTVRGAVHGLTSRYRVHQLFCGEEYGYIEGAIASGTQINRWRRANKPSLIASVPSGATSDALPTEARKSQDARHFRCRPLPSPNTE
jgi:hypothetical protein